MDQTRNFSSRCAPNVPLFVFVLLHFRFLFSSLQTERFEKRSPLITGIYPRMEFRVKNIYNSLPVSIRMYACYEIV